MSEVEKAGADWFLTYYRTAIPLLDTDFDVSTATDQQKQIDGNRDWYLPFKMHLPSLLALQQSGGAYTAENINTRGGIFSALTHRGALHGTEAGRFGPGYFPTYDDWLTFYHEHKHKGEAWFCNTRAHAQPIVQRHTDSVQLFWEASAELHQKLKTGNESFESIWKWVTKSKNCPGMGTLVAFVFCGDLAHLGVIDMPTADETADFVRVLNRGAMAGLEHLGLVPKRAKGANGKRRKGSKSIVRDAFVKLYSYMDLHLTSTEKETTDWTPMVLENGLCKIQRVEGDIDITAV